MLLAATALLLATAGPAVATVPRADLVVTGGTVTASAAGKLSGRFVVANRGRARAGRSTAALSVKATGRWRAVKRFAVARISAHASRKLTVVATLPKGLRVGRLPLRVCADSGQDVREHDNTNNCRTVGAVTVRAPAPVPTPAPVPAPTPAPLPAPAPVAFSRPASSVPTNPITFSKDTVFHLADDQGGYWIDVPASYDATHRTPTTLFVWMHGCEGKDADDIGDISPAGRSWIAIAIDGREGDCWYPDVDMPKVLSAVADVKTHFNVDPRRVVIGGYSSGGDLAYRTAFYNAYTFAGVLAENTSPFKDTGSTQQQSLAAAYWKFNVVHLAHTEDDTYTIDGVRTETDALKAAGFPVTRIERPGHHYDDPSPGAGTVHDAQTYLLPHLDDGWLAPP